MPTSLWDNIYEYLAPYERLLTILNYLTVLLPKLLSWPGNESRQKQTPTLDNSFSIERHLVLWSWLTCFSLSLFFMLQYLLADSTPGPTLYEPLPRIFQNFGPVGEPRLDRHGNEHFYPNPIHRNRRNGVHRHFSDSGASDGDQPGPGGNGIRHDRYGNQTFYLNIPAHRVPRPGTYRTHRNGVHGGFSSDDYSDAGGPGARGGGIRCDRYA